MVLEALNGIDLAVAEAEDACMRGTGRREDPSSMPPPTNNHIFVNAVAPDPEVTPQDVADHIGELMDRFQVGGYFICVPYGVYAFCYTEGVDIYIHIFGSIVYIWCMFFVALSHDSRKSNDRQANPPNKK